MGDFSIFDSITVLYKNFNVINRSNYIIIKNSTQSKYYNFLCLYNNKSKINEKNFNYLISKLNSN